MWSRRLPKICAVALVLATAGADGKIPPHHQSSCNQPTSNQAMYSLRTPSSRLPMNALTLDPWFNHRDLWHNGPFGRSPHHLLPWGISNRPWAAGLSILSPSHLADTDWTLEIGCQRCQDNAVKMMSNKGNNEVDPDCQRREAGNQWDAKPITEDEIKGRQQYKWEKEQEQQIEEQQRFQEVMRQRMQEEEELKQRQDKRRLEEEKRRVQQKRQQEAARRQKQLWEEEEQRIKKETREKQEREAAERRIQKEEAIKRRKMQEQKVAEERKRKETDWNYPSKGTNDDMRYRHSSFHQNQRPQFRKIEVASLNIPGYTPEDLSVTTSRGRLVVEGKHVCHCHEKCTEKEFKRGFQIPRNVDLASLEANLVKGGRMTITGNQFNDRVQPTEDLEVSVKGDGSFSPRPIRNVDPTCEGKRTGLKLKKMNKRTGEIVDDVEDLLWDMPGRTFEDEVDEDGVTMEVEY